MKSFKQYLDENKNTHMIHVENMVIYGGVDGTREAINFLRGVRDSLAGKSGSSHNLTVKFDGAPAIFAGYDPVDGKFFVAKKGIFNKNPKVYKSNSDIDSDTSGDLSVKLKVCLKELPAIIKSGIYQGDLMFTKSDIKKEKIGGESVYTFQPNTILYAVPLSSDIGKVIKSSQMGIVFHTKYTGNSFESLTASFSVSEKEFTKNSRVWVRDANVRDLSGTVTMTENETKEVTRHLSTAGKIFRQISGNVLRELEANPDFTRMIETHDNTYVRSGTNIKNTARHVDSLIKFIGDRFHKEIEKRSTAKGKQPQIDKRDEILKFFSADNKKNLKLIYDLQLAIVDAKMIIIQKLNSIEATKTFAKTKDGYKVTNHEGYVISDRMSNNSVKLVDRFEFSYLNFSPDIIKGWQK